MPELPEIAHLGRTLEAHLPGAVVRRVVLRRPDVVRCSDGRTRRPRRRVPRASLLRGERIDRLDRHGKELALVAASGGSLCIHLGMSGQLWYRPAGRPLPRTDHVHCTWHLESPTGAGRLVFRDPRRFGGIWSYPSADALHAERWSRLGPDALTIDARALAARLATTRRPVKTALLDQAVMAGVGNIYADEILFAARVHPLSVASSLPREAGREIAAATRRILAQAIARGGSTIRDYVDSGGRPGGFARRHRVYGRQGLPCTRCGRRLRSSRVAQRTTVFCPTCQRRYGS